MNSNQDAACKTHPSLSTGHCTTGVQCACLPAVYPVPEQQIKAVHHHSPYVARVRHNEGGHP